MFAVPPARSSSAAGRMARTGNVSVALPDGGWLLTPTGSSLGTLDPARLSKLDATGHHIDGDKPTKEAFLHTTMYAKRPKAGAVVHLHSTHSVAVSCLDGIDATNVLPPITAYYVMRIGKLPLVPYYPPGDKTLADAVGALADSHNAVLLANHGPVVAGSNLAVASDAIEELEETAKLYLMLLGKPLKLLTPEQVAELREVWLASGIGLQRATSCTSNSQCILGGGSDGPNEYSALASMLVSALWSRRCCPCSRSCCFHADRCQERTGLCPLRCCLPREHPRGCLSFWLGLLVDRFEGRWWFQPTPSKCSGRAFGTPGGACGRCYCRGQSSPIP